MKKVLAVLLLAVMLMGCAHCEEEENVVVALQKALADHLLFSEKVYAIEEWAYDYVLDFTQNRTIENLNLARSAVNTALNELGAMAYPESRLTDDQCFELMMQGIEAEALIAYADAGDGILEEAVECMNSVFDTLMYDVYWEEAVQNLQELVCLLKEYDRFARQDSMLLANYLMLQVKNKPLHDSFFEIMRPYCPGLFSALDELCADEEEAAEKGSAVIDEISKCVNEIDVKFEFVKHMYFMTLQAMETNDYSAFSGKRTEILNEEGTFPAAYWMFLNEPQYVFLFTDPETGDVFAPRAGKEIPCQPDSISMIYNDIDADDFWDYLELLVVCGCDTIWEFNAESGDIFIKSIVGTSSLVLKWSNGKVTVHHVHPTASIQALLYRD